MFRHTVMAGSVVLALGAAWCAPAASADAQPQSLLQLFNRLPKTPLTSQDADRLVDANQQMPVLAALRADLTAHADAVAQIAGAADARIRSRMGGGASSTDQALRTAAAAGIDMARLQTDKAYASEVQARMKSMPPQELMALMAAMSPVAAPRGTVAVYDPPAVKAAAEAGQALMQPDQLTARLAASSTRWATVDRKVAAIEAKYAAKFPRMQLSCDGEGGGRPECVAERARYTAAMMPLLRARDAEILQVEAAALEEERTALAPQVRLADGHLLAAQYGAASQELGHPAYIAHLDGVVAGEIGSLANRLESVAKRAALVAHCGDKLLSNPGDCYARR